MGKKKLINAENYVVSFPLLTEKWQEDILDQRFELLRKIQLSNGNIHQRDMLAAFNLQHLLIDGCKKDKDNYDVKGMIYDYENFYKMEQAELNRHRNSNKKVLSTMGIK